MFRRAQMGDDRSGVRRPRGCDIEIGPSTRLLPVVAGSDGFGLIGARRVRPKTPKMYIRGRAREGKAHTGSVSAGRRAVVQHDVREPGGLGTTDATVA